MSSPLLYLVPTFPDPDEILKILESSAEIILESGKRELIPRSRVPRPRRNPEDSRIFCGRMILESGKRERSRFSRMRARAGGGVWGAIFYRENPRGGTHLTLPGLTVSEDPSVLLSLWLKAIT